MTERYYLRFTRTNQRVLHKDGYVYAFDTPEQATGSSRALKEYYGIDTCVCPILCDTNYLILTDEEQEILWRMNQGEVKAVGHGIASMEPKKAPSAVKRRIRIRKE